MPGTNINASPGLTNITFNITGNGTLGVIDPVIPGNMVSGVQTVNVFANTVAGAIATEAVQGDFTGWGPADELEHKQRR